MKLAIIGSGALALEAGVHFHNLGAQVKIFKSSNKWGGSLTSLSADSGIELEINKLATIAGRNFVNANRDFLCLEDYQNYLYELGTKLEELGLVKNGHALRIHKRFLNPRQLPQGRSRLADLFRLVYRIDARKDIEQQKSENKEIFEKLGEDVVNSLQDSIEAFEDFDLVINATGTLTNTLPAGAGASFALNEQVVSKESGFFYGKDIQRGLKSIDGKIRTLTFIGDGPYNLKALGQLKEKFSESNFKIQIITQSTIPFDTISTEVYGKWLADFQALLALDTEEFKNDVEVFENKIIQWKSLDDYIRVKTPRPTEPINRIHVYNGAVVSSVDKLLDQEGLFLTIEGSELLGGQEALKTLTSQLILVDNGHRSNSVLDEALDQDEPGYFNFKTESQYCLMESDFSQLNEIEGSIMKYFSKAQA